MEFGTFATLQASWFEKRIEALTLEQSLLEGRAVLHTLLGSEVGKMTSTKRIQLEEKEK
jgi:hypothetical protein